MKTNLKLIAFALLLGAAALPMHAQTCTNGTLNGKYVFSGQGDIYTPIWNAYGTQVGKTDTTVSSTGYFVADGDGHITSARLFQATNSGVSDTSPTANAGTYSITDCDNGTVTLTFGSTTHNYNIDPDNIDSNNLAHNAAMLDADNNRDESFKAVRTVDPVSPYVCGNGFTLAGVATSGMERGHTPAGQPQSALVALTYGVGTISGSEKISTPQGFSTEIFTGTYTIQSDCAVLLTRTINGTQISGAHIISGGDSKADNDHQTIWQGDDDVAALVVDNGCGMSDPYCQSN